MSSKDQVAALERAIRTQFPGWVVEVDEPSLPSGDWFIDVVGAGDQPFTVVYRSGLGFGLSSAPPEGYGDGPDEVFGTDVGAVLDRLGELASTGRRTTPQRARVLKELRGATSMTQAELARRLGVTQPAVSKMERRADTSLMSLRRYVEALGGELYVVARFESPEGQLEVAFQPERSAEPTTNAVSVEARQSSSFGVAVTSAANPPARLWVAAGGEESHSLIVGEETPATNTPSAA